MWLQSHAKEEERQVLAADQVQRLQAELCELRQAIQVWLLAVTSLIMAMQFGLRNAQLAGSLLGSVLT